MLQARYQPSLTTCLQQNEDKWTAAELNNILLNNVVWGPHAMGPWSSLHVWWHQMGMRPVQQEAQGAMLPLQHRRASFPGEKPTGNTNILYTTSYTMSSTTSYTMSYTI
jgi:hypothetical protein